MRSHAEFLRIADEQTAEQLNAAVLDIGFAVSAAAVQGGSDELDAELVSLCRDLQAFPPEDCVALLIAVTRQLSMSVRAVASGSDHPHAVALRAHRTLTDLNAARIPDEAAEYLARTDRIDQATARIGQILRGERPA